ncbi:MAG: PASTA domain-containing protein, partial [Actinobacteria bacterium]|nr:PASTA domain-containing protein [Actinomycetota bacterium]
QHQHTQTKVLEPEVADQVSSILPGVITSGTGTSANIGRPAAGKTGSSQNNVDAWFCGYTPQLATAVWVGFAKPRPGPDGRLQPVPMTYPNTRITVFGGTYPAQIWATFMRQALANQPPLPLIDPTASAPTTTTVPAGNTALLSPMTVPPTVKVPDVGGTDAAKAVASIQSAGLVAVRLDATVAGVGAGTVVGQSPAPSTSVKSGSTVFVEATPGTFAPDAAVPDVIGYGSGQARQLLESLGFTVTAQAEPAPAGSTRSDGQPFDAGQVWRTTPVAGTKPTDGSVAISYQTASAAPPTSQPSTTTTPRARTGGSTVPHD